MTAAVLLSELEGRIFVSVPELAELMGCDPRTVRAGIEKGEIPATRIGHVWRIPMEWVEKAANRNET